MRLRFAHGFSLIELMIVLAIMGIVVMFAYPSYTNYVLKSRRTEAKSGLLDLAQRQEDFRADNNKYADDLTKLLLNNPDLTSENGFYKFSVENPSPLKFTLKATVADDKAQKDDIQCTEFSIDQQGKRDSEPGKDCW